MHKKSLAECSPQERDARWRDSHARGQAQIKEGMISSGVRPDKADREAQRKQAEVTERARQNSEGG